MVILSALIGRSDWRLLNMSEMLTSAKMPKSLIVVSVGFPDVGIMLALCSEEALWRPRSAANWRRDGNDGTSKFGR